MASRKKRADRFVRAVGEAPGCLGHYQAGHTECDGDIPCGWQRACRAYTFACEARGLAPEVEREALPEPVIIGLITDLLAYGPSMGAPLKAHVARGWIRFRGALAAELMVPLHDAREFAADGEAYVQTWGYDRQRGTFLAATVRACGVIPRWPGGRYEAALVRYWPNLARRLSPTIEIRAELPKLIAAFPDARDLCQRWQRSAGTGRVSRQVLGAAAVNVKPERIEDVARLAARLLEAGLFRGIAMRHRRLVSVYDF